MIVVDEDLLAFSLGASCSLRCVPRRELWRVMGRGESGGRIVSIAMWSSVGAQKSQTS